MNKKILLIIAILLLAALFLFVVKNRNANVSADGQQTSCDSTPLASKSQCEQTDAWLNQKLVEWKPSTYHPMKFGTLFPPLSYTGEMYQDDTKFSDNYLSALKDLNLDLLRIDLYYDAWLNNDAKHIRTTGEIISHIKNNGYKLMIVNIGAKQYEKNPVPWAVYQKSTLNIIGNFTKEYKPDYYEVVDEPVTFSKGGNHAQTTEPVSADEWINFTEEACNLVKSINPRTKVAVGTTPFEEEYFRKMIKLDCVDIVGINVYDSYGLEKSKMTELIALAKKEGKETWILETWLDWQPSTGKPWKAQLDAKWINATVYYAQNNGMSGYMPFFTRHFFSYSDKQFEGFMPAFYAYKNIISDIRLSN